MNQAGTGEIKQRGTRGLDVRFVLFFIFFSYKALGKCSLCAKRRSVDSNDVDLTHLLFPGTAA